MPETEYCRSHLIKCLWPLVTSVWFCWFRCLAPSGIKAWGENWALTVFCYALKGGMCSLLCAFRVLCAVVLCALCAPGWEGVIETNLYHPLKSRSEQGPITKWLPFHFQTTTSHFLSHSIAHLNANGIIIQNRGKIVKIWLCDCGGVDILNHFRGGESFSRAHRDWSEIITKINGTIRVVDVLSLLI